MSRTATAADVCEVCAIVPAEAPGDAFTPIRHGQIAALTTASSGMDAPSPEAALHRTRRLDRMTPTWPVLPIRFGTVVFSPENVAGELLAPNEEIFAAALAQLRGRAQFAVRARYIAEAVVRDALATDPALLRMHRRLRDSPGAADQAGRIALGHAVAARIAVQRQRDAETIAQVLHPHAVLSEVALPESAGGYRLADAALLMDLPRQAELEQAVAQLAVRWRDRVRLRLLGPMAAYHFADRLTTGAA